MCSFWYVSPGYSWFTSPRDLTPPPRTRRYRLVVPPDEEEIACDFCESTHHLTTECPTTPDIVYDQAETPPCARLPGEHLDSPATWSTIHHATFLYLVTSVIQYYRIVHNSPAQRQTLLQQIATSLDLHYPIALDSPLAPPGLPYYYYKRYHIIIIRVIGIRD
jgi:hypothetical protein